MLLASASSILQGRMPLSSIRLGSMKTGLISSFIICQNRCFLSSAFFSKLKVKLTSYSPEKQQKTFA